MQEVIVKIRLLIDAAHEHLEEQGFLTSTIKRYSRCWEKLAHYMSRSGVRNYNRKVGQNYLEHLFKRFSYSKLNKQEKAIVRKVQYLTEFQEKCTVLKKRKGPEARFIGSIGKLMESFLLARQEAGLSASTAISTKRYLHVFLTFVEEQGINSLHSIKRPHVIAFVESQKKKV